VRLLLLTARPELEVNRRLAEAAGRLAATLEVVDATRACAVSGARPALWLEATDLLDPPPAAVLARVGNWRPDSVLAALEVAVAAGATTPNPPPAMRVGRDHWRTVQRLAAAGVPAPPTVAGADPEALAAVAVDRLGLPVVVKQRRSRMGVGVIRCDTRDHLEAVLDSLWRVGDEVVVQRHLDTGGASLRLLVVGGRVVAAARFVAAPGEWRSNAARGGLAEPYQPLEAEAELAVAAAAAVGLGVCGVDLLPAAGGTVVGEVNPSPGFRRLQAASGVDVAAAIIAETLASNQR
jgi:ribosomal protein S6--L-glutamate ligase